MEIYYTASFCLYRIEHLFHKKALDRKYYKIKYHLMMMLRHEIINELHPPFNSKKALTYANSVLAILKEDKKLLEKMQVVIKRIDDMDIDLSNNEVSKSKKFVADCLAAYQ
jgi:hypothetical protein